jgi:hypothetical protein
MSTEKVRFDRLCRVAKRRGFDLKKPRHYDKLHPEYGTFHLVDRHTGSGFHRLTLDDVEKLMGMSLEKREALFQHNLSRERQKQFTADNAWEHTQARQAKEDARHSGNKV